MLNTIVRRRYIFLRISLRYTYWKDFRFNILEVLRIRLITQQSRLIRLTCLLMDPESDL